jgi:antiviral helicase SKI2
MKMALFLDKHGVLPD